jgi:phospholipid-binding lipoprotein MlaA
MSNDFPPIPSRRTAAMIFILLIASIFCAGCASGPPNPDPWEKTNRFLYRVNDGIDKYALKPAADVYIFIVPKPLRIGIGNGFDNLVYFNVIFNDFLQGKGDQGWSDLGRMALNSTVGFAGFFDVATSVGLPAHENDFGVTLGKWGVGPGPYIVIPLIGPSTVRDAVGLGVKYAATPTSWLNLPWSISIPLYAAYVIDLRSREYSLARFRDEAAVDPYLFTRSAYLQYRDGLINEGKPPTTQNDVFDEDIDSGSATAPATTPSTTQPASKP